MTFVLHYPTAQYYRNEARFTGDLVRRMLAADPRLELRFIDATIDDDYYARFSMRDGTWTEGLMDDFFIVESLRTGRFKVVDFQDSYTITWCLSKSPNFVAAAVMMFHPPTVAWRYGADAHKIHPGWFVDQEPSKTAAFREQAAWLRRQELDPRLFFRGTIHGETPGREYLREGRNIREVALVLREKYPDEVDISGHKLPRGEEWWAAAARHRWVLTLPGHPWCYREFEMMSLGIPTITLRWTSYLYHQPVHYVAVDGLEQDPIGFALDPEKAADAIIAKFKQVRDDDLLMTSIGHQAQRWYDRFMTPARMAEDILTFLDLDRL